MNTSKPLDVENSKTAPGTSSIKIIQSKLFCIKNRNIKNEVLQNN